MIRDMRYIVCRICCIRHSVPYLKKIALSSIFVHITACSPYWYVYSHTSPIIRYNVHLFPSWISHETSDSTAEYADFT